MRLQLQRHMISGEMVGRGIVRADVLRGVVQPKIKKSLNASVVTCDAHFQKMPRWVVSDSLP